MTVTIKQAPPSLIPAGQPVPSTPSSAPATPTAAEQLAAAPKPAYSEDWTKSIIRYFCNLAAAEWGPEMAATEIEIQLLAPALQAVLNHHAPDVASGADQTASLAFVAILVLVMGARRGLVVRRKAREAKAKAAHEEPTPVHAPPAPAPGAPVPTTVRPPSDWKPPTGTVMGGVV